MEDQMDGLAWVEKKDKVKEQNLYLIDITGTGYVKNSPLQPALCVALDI
jgi:hypothetical protein